MRRNSGIIGPKIETDSTSASGLHDLFDCYNSKKDNSWPQFQVDSVSNSNGTALNEATNNTITVTTSGVPDSTTLYYSIATVSGTTLTSADFDTGDVTGSFTITNNSGSFVLKPVGDDLSESNVVKIQIRRGSVSGDILGETGNLTIADAASPVASFNWKYYAYGSSINETYILWVQSNGTQNTLRTITGQQQSNATSSWISYTEDLSSYSGTTGRIYVAYKTGSNFRQDIQFDDMELVETTAGDISHDPSTSTGRSRLQKYTTFNTILTAPTTNTSYSSITDSQTAQTIWNFDEGGTLSGDTASSTDAAGSSSGIYLYFEGSNPNFTTSTRYYWFRMSQDYTLL